MNAEDCITNFVSARLSVLKTDYYWKVNPKRLPVPYEVGAVDNVTENVRLRRHLHGLIKARHPESAAICHWYVRDWGGVRGNKQETLEGYIAMDDKSLIALGTKGISTWSKILCLRDPGTYAIYDCRVAVALAILQEQAHVERPIMFPTLKGKSRNAVIREAQEKLLDNHSPVDFYASYGALLKTVALRAGFGDDIQSVEMVLFANAPALCEDFIGSGRKSLAY